MTLRLSLPSPSFFTLCCLVAVTAFSVPSHAQDQPPNPDEPFAVVSASNVDENLFALHLLSDVYANWPDLASDRTSVDQYFQYAHKRVAAMQARMRVRQMDPKIVQAYSDCAEYIAATDRYLLTLDLIKKEQSNDAFWNAVGSVWDATKLASDVKERAGIVMSPKNAADAGKLVGAANGIVTYYNKSQASDATALSARAEQARQLQARWTVAYSSAQGAAKQLTVKYGWANGEAGFDDFQSTRLGDYVSRSPSDPFVQEKYGSALSRQAKTGNDEVPAINAFLTAARDVPAEPIYQSLRTQYLAEADRAALKGALLDANYTYVNKPASSLNAMRLARTYLAENSADYSGYGHAALAQALGLSGRIPEAVQSAQAALRVNPNWRNDQDFALACAKLASLRGDPDDALNWLKQAFQDGYPWVRYVAGDPDMASVRRYRSQPFQAMLTPDWQAEVRFFSSGDDVFFQNNSAFDLTNIKLVFRARQGDKVWTHEVTLDWLKTGSSYEFKNVFDIPNNRLDEFHAYLTSDQWKG